MADCGFSAGASSSSSTSSLAADDDVFASFLFPVAVVLAALLVFGAAAAEGPASPFVRPLVFSSYPVEKDRPRANVIRRKSLHDRSGFLVPGLALEVSFSILQKFVICSC